MVFKVCKGIKEGKEQDACIVNHLSNMEFNIDGPTFNYLFVNKAGGEPSLAEHLWKKFHGYNHSILALWGSADLENRRKLITVIDEYPKSRKDLPWKEIRVHDDEIRRRERYGDE